MGIENLDSYLRFGKDALDLLKSALPFLPKGQTQDGVQAKVAAAERSLEESRAELAKELGYKLCRCAFPPAIMLWNKELRADVCPKCGDRNPPPVEVRRTSDHETSWIRARRGY